MPSQFTTVYTYVFLAIIFSTGLPILYPTVAAYCLVTYWVDKFLLIKFYKQPANYNTELAKGTLWYMKLAFLIHLFFSVYLFVN